MRIRTTLGTLGICVIALGVVAAGCSSGAPSPTSTQQGGLTVLHSDPAVGVSVSFSENGRVVFLETRVGAPKQAIYQKSFPNEPLFEMDARVVDQEGRAFELTRGGDAFVDPTWAPDAMANNHLTSVAEGVQRDNDFAIARDAAQAFAAQAGPELADHVFHLTNLTHIVPREDPGLQAEAAVLRAQRVGDVAFNSNGCSSNTQEGKIYTAALTAAEGLVSAISGAQHSTVGGWNYNHCTDTWDQQVNACNHGPCAQSSTVTLGCNSQSGAEAAPALLDYWVDEPSGTTGTVSGACTSKYGIVVADITWFGAGNPDHVCNDDSAYELEEIKQHTKSTSYGTGANFAATLTGDQAYNCQNPGAVHMYAPPCP
ncbi:MAG: hypothetical protein ACLQVI_41300 [Polyangiaceae bacterium]